MATDAVAERGPRVPVVRLPPSIRGDGEHGFVPAAIRCTHETGGVGIRRRQNELMAGRASRAPRRAGWIRSARSGGPAFQAVRSLRAMDVPASREWAPIKVRLLEDIDGLDISRPDNFLRKRLDSRALIGGGCRSSGSSNIRGFCPRFRSCERDTAAPEERTDPGKGWRQ